jgi:predicted transcriptional regulator
LYFIDLKTFLQILSPGRLNLLYTLRAQGKTSVQALSQMLARKYQHAFRDVQILKKAGLR